LAKPLKLDEFRFSPDDPLAPEHAIVSVWVADAIASPTKDRWYWEIVELKTLASGRALLRGKPEQLRRNVLAAVAQVQHWDRLADQLRATAPNEYHVMNPEWLPGWKPVWIRRVQTAAVIVTLIQRALPFRSNDLVELLNWCSENTAFSKANFPIGQIARSLKRYAAEGDVDSQLLGAMRKFAARLRSAPDGEMSRIATTVEQLCVLSGPELAAELAKADKRKFAPLPGLAGAPGVLTELKRFRGMTRDDAEPPISVIGPDHFPLNRCSSLQIEHQLLTAFLEEIVRKPRDYFPSNLARYETGSRSLALDPESRARVILAAAERHVHGLLTPSGGYNDIQFCQARDALGPACEALLKASFVVGRDGSFDLMLYLSARPPNELIEYGNAINTLITMAESEAESRPLTEGERFVLYLFRASLISGPPLGASSGEVQRLSCLVDDGATFYLVPGEAWSDALNVDISRCPAGRKSNWVALLRHALTATAARPTPRWLQDARTHIAAVGAGQVVQSLSRWLPLVSKGQTIRRLGLWVNDVRGAADLINEENATCLRGLLWSVQVLPRRLELVRQISSVAQSAYKKVPGVGSRAVKVGNAAVYALSEMGSTDAVGQLAVLKARVRFGTAQKEIEKAFITAAAALRLRRDQIEEMGVPSYGLEEIGVRRESFNDHRALLVINGSDTELKWFDAKDKPLKSVPASVKRDYKDDLRDLQQSLRDIQAMLPAQRDRIDSMFLLRKIWALEEWQERYLNHPLVATISRRLLWCVDGAPALFIDGNPTNVDAAPVTCCATSQIALWHPVGRTIAEITSWRRRLEELGITQPFKQAHREVYLLTDAERNSRTYSNRFAAHIIRQHQFNALCAARGWKNKLQLMVDADFPPASKELPQWGLRAEFWIEGVGETNDSGAFLSLATDQVRFYRLRSARGGPHENRAARGRRAAGLRETETNEPIPLEQVPPLVFSEIMRDVDLFIGVASVGNDPTWQDGGPDGIHRDYWQDYAFGPLTGTAATRKQVLERMVPRLKIADRCSFSDRFLIVRGQKRTYKIHLGSGNILMEPNDQYLCIVPDSRLRARGDELFLPFEGDSTLSIIISKANLLAADATIKDPTITRQIDAR
jgi:hypothetical protein